MIAASVRSPASGNATHLATGRLRASLLIFSFTARVDLQLVEERRQPPDHPVSPQFREGRYLKCLVYRRVG